MSHKKFGADRFSRFDVYWIQTNKQTNRQTDRQTKFILNQLNEIKTSVIFLIQIHQITWEIER